MATGSKPPARPRPVPAARPAPAPAPADTSRPARVAHNFWSCPWDDRAMRPGAPCDVCGAVLRGTVAVRTI